jgi:hypothetical protein
MPTPAEAAAILRQHFGFAADPANPDSGVGDPTGAVALGGLRSDQIAELEDRLPNEASAAVIPMEGFVPGEPGRRYVSRLPAANLIGDSMRLAQLRGEEAGDPFTGEAAQARVGNIQHTLDDAATTMRPEVDAAARTLAERNAFADYMKAKGLKTGELAAAASPEAYAAGVMPSKVALSGEAQALADTNLEREGRKRMLPQLEVGQLPLNTGGGGGGGEAASPGEDIMGTGYTMSRKDKNIGAKDLDRISSMAGVWPMLTDLKAMLDPSANIVTNKIGATLRLGMYNLGLPPGASLFGNDDPKVQARIQLADLIKIMGASPFMAGSRNYKYMTDVYRHLTNPGATDAFLYNQINELQKRWPQIQRAIIQTHANPATPLDQMMGPQGVGSSDPWAPPTPDEINRR